MLCAENHLGLATLMCSLKGQIIDFTSRFLFFPYDWHGKEKYIVKIKIKGVLAMTHPLPLKLRWEFYNFFFFFFAISFSDYRDSAIVKNILGGPTRQAS